MIFLDTETRVVSGTDPELLTLRLWVAHYVDRRTSGTTKPRDEWGTGTTADELAAWITRVTRNRDTIWLYCHNLGFDLVTTRLPMRMQRHEWTVRDASIGGKAPWMILGRGKRVLTVTDSYSWLPTSLERIGDAVTIAKPELPADGDGLDAWEARCRADVAILEAAMLDLMTWWDRAGLGRWAISGATAGWNAFRHTPTDWPVVIDPEPATVKAERGYVHGGRRGTWRVGELHAGPFLDVDFTAAYPTIAAHCALPTKRERAFDSLPVDSRLVDTPRWGITARVRVETDVPRWPVRIDGRTWYPVGEFWAELAGPDIAEARRLGCLREIGPGHVHRLGYSMQAWAQWILRVQAGADDDAPPVAVMVAKHWGRAVIGKWASRGFDKVKLGPAPTFGWHYEQGRDVAGECDGGMVDICGQRWWVSASGDPDNAYPAVLAWVEAEVRVRLNRAVEALGDGAVLQCDTDGMLVAERTAGTPAAHGAVRAPAGLDPAGRLSWCLAEIAPLLAPLRLRVKARHAHVRILGPQHLTLDGARRYAGLPGTAEETAPDEYRVQLWPGLQWQMTNGSDEGYVRPWAAPVVKGPWPTGWVLDDNTVAPVEARIDRAGASVLIGWNSSQYARAGHAASRTQHPGLEPLL